MTVSKVTMRLEMVCYYIKESCYWIILLLWSIQFYRSVTLHHREAMEVFRKQWLWLVQLSFGMVLRRMSKSLYRNVIFVNGSSILLKLLLGCCNLCLFQLTFGKTSHWILL